MEHRPADNKKLAVMAPGSRPLRSLGRGDNLRSALFSSTLSAYIEGAIPPGAAMGKKGRRNKPIGPGGSTRRLHPCSVCVSNPIPVGSVLSVRLDLGAASAGPKQDRRGRKGRAFARDGSDVTGHSIVANDNYAPVAQAA